MKPGLWMSGPLAALYALWFEPEGALAWAEATFVMWLVLIPPCALGYIVAWLEPDALKRRTRP